MNGRPRKGIPKNKRRSISIGGRRTSVGLEGAFWFSLKEIAAAEDLSVSELVARINAGRRRPNLSSAIRIYILEHYRRLIELDLKAKARGKR
jgi:predicted DNA-binding ribbon-helix-helix protein